MSSEKIGDSDLSLRLKNLIDTFREIQEYGRNLIRQWSLESVTLEGVEYIGFSEAKSATRYNELVKIKDKLHENISKAILLIRSLNTIIEKNIDGEEIKKEYNKIIESLNECLKEIESWRILLIRSYYVSGRYYYNVPFIPIIPLKIIDVFLPKILGSLEGFFELVKSANLEKTKDKNSNTLTCAKEINELRKEIELLAQDIRTIKEKIPDLLKDLIGYINETLEFLRKHKSVLQ
ncbi:MAG: hypothetical protein ACP6IQ_05515 [Candidatus Njordarchaeia archaeon]